MEEKICFMCGAEHTNENPVKEYEIYDMIDRLEGVEFMCEECATLCKEDVSCGSIVEV